MVNAKTLILTILNWNKILIEWENVGESTTENLIIERSDAPDSEYKEIATVADTVETYTDEDPETHRKYIPYYYRIKNADDTYSEIVHLPYEVNKYLLQHIWLMNRHLERDVGITSYYFHYKRYGSYCDCWDPELKKSVVKDCVICAGTGRIVGYADPVAIYVSYPPDSPTQVDTGHKRYSVLAPRAWTSNYPLIFPEDIIVRGIDKEVFIIQGEVVRSGRKMYPGRQMFNIQAVEHGAVQYALVDRIPAS